ncbi:uncharacterized protein LOC126664593 [Mercurialis annua]|uniref:uncharacterized protein LOC126664593 n=1 Tax=Mercurialis annua TaxID=3986 RepID=UPI00215E688E|nr:uncharacterized protein LOC126664593 [Mercurialis annua]
MAPTKPDGRCRKHPKHKQSPGVCSICLSDKLSQISRVGSASSSTDSVSSGSSSLSSYSSSSSCSSPVYRDYEGRGSLSFLLSGKINVLTKSRSLAFVSRTRLSRGNNNKEKVGDDENKIKSGFLSKLLWRPRNKRREEGLVHSRTMRERMMMSISTKVN